MASSEDQCLMCLDVISNPVSISCGHTFCNGCITGYWGVDNRANDAQCPLCKETLQTKTTSNDSSSTMQTGVVTCDLCHGMKRQAVKSCLVCLASYCCEHLQPHHTAQVFSWHKLINPVATLAHRVCKKHNKLIEFFCREDQSCVCVLCLRDDHVTHEAVTVEEEFKERKSMLECSMNQVNHTVIEKSVLAQGIQKLIEQSRKEVDRTAAETDRAFTALVASIKAKKVKLTEQLEEMQRTAEQKAEALIRQLQLEIKENHQMSSTLEKLLKTDDSFTATKPLFQEETIKKMVAKIEETLNQEMDNIVTEDILETEDETNEGTFDDDLAEVQKQNAIHVTLDPNTAHPALFVSEDRKQVRHAGTKRNVPDNTTRFNSLHCVLGNEGFSSGKFYYEVMVKGSMGWEVGVVRESISRRGTNVSLSPENGCWTLGSHSGRCQANLHPPLTLSLSKEPQKVGVFVDYEEGLVSFYDVDSRSLIYSFKQCAFTAPGESLVSRIMKLRIYSGNPGKTMIYPIFRVSDEGGRSAGLKIIPVVRSEGS